MGEEATPTLPLLPLSTQDHTSQPTTRKEGNRWRVAMPKHHSLPPGAASTPTTDLLGGLTWQNTAPDQEGWWFVLSPSIRDDDALIGPPIDVVQYHMVRHYGKMALRALSGYKGHHPQSWDPDKQCAPIRCQEEPVRYIPHMQRLIGAVYVLENMIKALSIVGLEFDTDYPPSIHDASLAYILPGTPDGVMLAVGVDIDIASVYVEMMVDAKMVVEFEYQQDHGWASGGVATKHRAGEAYALIAAAVGKAMEAV